MSPLAAPALLLAPLLLGVTASPQPLAPSPELTIEELEERVRGGDEAASVALVKRLMAEPERRYRPRRPRPAKHSAFRTLVKHDPVVRAWIAKHFPAGVVIEASPTFGRTGPGHLRRALERGSAELGLDIDGRGAGASTLIVHMEITENDTSGQSIFKSNAMKSYSIGVTAELVSADGEVLARGVDDVVTLGISPKHAMLWGVDRLSQSLLYSVLNDVVFHARRSEL
jgi:hypothetical protein